MYWIKSCFLIWLAQVLLLYLSAVPTLSFQAPHCPGSKFVLCIVLSPIYGTSHIDHVAWEPLYLQCKDRICITVKQVKLTVTDS